MTQIRKHLKYTLLLALAGGMMINFAVPAAAQKASSNLPLFSAKWTSEPVRFRSGIPAVGGGGTTGIVQRDDFRFKIVNPNPQTSYVMVRCYGGSQFTPIASFSRSYTLSGYRTQFFDSFDSLETGDFNVSSQRASLYCTFTSIGGPITVYGEHTGLYETEQGQGLSHWQDVFGLIRENQELPLDISLERAP